MNKSKPTEEKGLEVTQPNIVMPAVSPEEAVEAWNAYQALKRKIATPDDVQTIQGKEFYKKSYWRKIATFFNLSVEVVEERKEELENNVVYHFTQKAIAPNGRFAFGVGSCDLLEKGRRNTIHNARGTAETRAFNRAVSNLVGGGEVSAEEITEVDSHPQTAEPVKPQVRHENGYTYEPVEQTIASPNGKCPICHTTGKYHRPDCPNKT